MTDEGAQTGWAPDAPEAPAPPDSSLFTPDTAASPTAGSASPPRDSQRPPAPIQEAEEEESAELPEVPQDPAYRPPAVDEVALLRRAMGTDGFAPQDDGDDPSLWDDTAARRELSLLTRLGVVGAVCVALAVAYFLGGGFPRHPHFAFLMIFVDGTMLLALVGLYVFGFFATVRRRLFGWMALGLLCPFIYSIWAAITRRRIRADSGGIDA